MMRDNRKDTRGKSSQSSKATGLRKAQSYGYGSVGNIDNRRKQRNKRRKRDKKLVKYGLILLAGIIIISTFAFLTRKNGGEVFIGEESIGQVKGKNLTTEYFVNTVVAQLETASGTKVQLNEKVEVKPVHVNKKKMVTSDHMASKIKEIVTYKVQAAVITVDSIEVLTLKNKTESDEVLQHVIEEYIPEGSNIVKEECGFVENVQVVERFVDSEEITTKENAVQLLTSGTEAKRTYSVKSGDSLYKIAQNNGATVEELLTANPEITLNTGLNVGQEINLVYMKPYVSVKTIEYVVFTEKAPKEQDIQYDGTKQKGYKKVIQQGKDGQKEVTTQIVRVNGFEEEQKVVSEKVTQNPVTEVIVVGTK